MTTSTKKSTATSTASTEPKSTTQVELQDMQSGFQTALPPTITTLVVNGASMTPAQVEAELQKHISVYSAVVAAKEPYTVAVAAKNADEQAAVALLKGLRVFVRQLFPNDPTSQAKFGLISKPKAPATPLNKAASVAKATSTREKKKAAAAAAASPEPQVLILGPDGTPLVGSLPETPAAPTAATPPTAGK